MEINQQLKKYSSQKRRKSNKGFFKTGPGEYGEGDKFIGVSMPDIRKVVKLNKNVTFYQIKKLLDSKVHEERMCGLLILVYQYEKTRNKKEIFDFYIKNRKTINNWDLIDVTTPKIVGNYLLDKDRKLLYKFANSKNLWEKRIAILATFAFIKNDDFIDSLQIAKILLTDKNDLTHKAVGWMLREIWKRNNQVIENFIHDHYSQIPRTSLRYAIERMPEKRRKAFLENAF